jgi:hypothetical protein
LESIDKGMSIKMDQANKLVEEKLLMLQEQLEQRLKGKK